MSMDLTDITEAVLASARAWRGPDFNEWDINCGWCEEWAVLAQRKYGGSLLWLDTVPGYEDAAHMVVVIGGRYYDSQHPTGVDSIDAIDLVRGVTRDEFLRARATR